MQQSTESQPQEEREAREESVRSRFVGAVLGTFIGDALGMPVEGLPPGAIVRKHGLVLDLLPARLGAGTYTDDTEMTLALAESLVCSRGFDGADLASRFLTRFDPRRGYGRGTQEALRLLRDGAAWNEAAAGVFGHGSFGNGSAMRVAPVGLLYHDDLDKVAAIARETSSLTHSHPLGRGGAAVQALAVALALRWGVRGDDSLDAGLFLAAISSRLGENEGLFGECLDKVRLMLDRHPGLPPEASIDERLELAEDVSAVLGHDSRSFQSVPAALYSFLSSRRSFEWALATAVSLGGDTDTIAAMTGAMAGAHLGEEALPKRWRAGLEEGARGATYAAGLGEDLFLVWLEMYSRRS